MSEIGKIYGRLTVIADGEPIVYSCGNKKTARCICVCGKEGVYRVHQLRSGHTQSCGCLQRERTGNASRVHGVSLDPVYGVFKDMRNRCYNEKNSMYSRYGGRGITICEEWLNNPRIFCEWARNNGWAKNLFIDRIDNDGDYEPKNCRFVTRSVNNNNRKDTRRLVHEGQSLSIREWSEKYKIPFRKLQYKINTGTSIDEALLSLTAKPK